MLPDPIDTLEGVGGRLQVNANSTDEADEDFTPLAPNEDNFGNGNEGEEESLSVDDNLDPAELANILNDGGNNEYTQPDQPEIDEENEINNFSSNASEPSPCEPDDNKNASI